MKIKKNGTEIEFIKKFTSKPTDNSIILICVIFNEKLLMKYFIKHYIDIGVTHFVFIDNNSEDDTVSYLQGRTDIDCQIYRTADSYAKNKYGLAWVNEILNSHCRDKWCVVVDADELITPDSNETLATIKSDMKSNSQNVLQTCLVDFYPKNLEEECYRSGSSFYSHSNYYDKFSKDDLHLYAGKSGELVVKGGVRHRIFGSNGEPVCLTKKSFFKYDFYDTHELSVGMHWLLPHDFTDWKAYKNWDSAYSNISYSSCVCAVAHFKFLKPNLFKFFEKRVEKNQDWNNSSEYKNYLNSDFTSFYDNKKSIKYSTNQKIYNDLINKIEKHEKI